MDAKRVLERSRAAREVDAMRRTPPLVRVFVRVAEAAADGLRQLGEGISMLALQMENRKLAERVRELEKKAERLQDDLIDALDESNDRKERITELEAEVERLREDATLGADLRCVLESGFEVEVNRGEWSICIERWSPFRTLAETAAVVREWQEGQKPEPAPPTVLGCPVKVMDLPDGVFLAVKDEAGHVAAVVNATIPSTPEPAPSPDDAARPARIVGRVTRPVWEAEPADGMEPAPSPEDEARARIAAAGAKVIGKWGVITSDGCEIWLTYPCNDGYALTELAAFAEAHRVASPPDGSGLSPRDIRDAVRGGA